MERTDEGQEKLDYVRLLRPVERDTHVRRGPAWLKHGHGVQIKRREVMHRLRCPQHLPWYLPLEARALSSTKSQLHRLVTFTVWLATGRTEIT
jgi:hypothetical protein